MVELSREQKEKIKESLVTLMRDCCFAYVNEGINVRNWETVAYYLPLSKKALDLFEGILFTIANEEDYAELRNEYDSLCKRAEETFIDERREDVKRLFMEELAGVR